MQNQDNPFWLKVKKEYILDNFEEMVEYLRRYRYENGYISPEYSDTLGCLRSVISDLDATLRETPFYAAVPDTGAHTPETVVRMMAAAVLASFKIGLTDHNVLLTLLNYLLYVYKDDISDDVWRGLWSIACACMRGQQLYQPGFKWTDINAADDFHIPVFAHRLAHCEFRGGNGSETDYYIEHNGLMMLDHKGLLRLAPMNMARYTAGPRYGLFDIDSLLTVEVPSSDSQKAASSFDGLYDEAKLCVSAMEQVIPSPQRTLKDYAVGDELVVRITRMYGIKIVAETVDREYNRIEGKVLLSWQDDTRPLVDNVRANLKVGDLVLVTRTDIQGFSFSLGESLENFYRIFASEFANRVLYAVYDSKLPDGSTMWITDKGIRVIVHKSKEDELNDAQLDIFDAAINDFTALPLRFYVNPPDIDSPAFKVYAYPDFFEYDPEDYHNVTITGADRKFMEEYHSESDAAARDVECSTRPSEKAGYECGDAFAHLLFCTACHDGLASNDRLRYLTAAAMMCVIAGRERSLSFLMHNMAMLDRLVAFSRNEDVRLLHHDQVLDGLSDVAKSEELVAVLASYKRPFGENAVVDTPLLRSDTAGELNRVRTLVRASNDLLGIIGGNELNNIKHAIVRLLKVDDEYKPLVGDRTYYGNESSTLEFKRSIVYPPKNRSRFISNDPDPEMQKWAILKAVCGFLNSRSGGELLLGVNDLGYADGIDDDVAELARKKLIPIADADHYRLYVQNIVDYAFKEYGAPTLSTDITTLNIICRLETNDEGKTILRVRVKPYPYGVVGFADGLRIPDGYVESYVRRDGCTQRLTDNLRLEVERYKLEAPTSAEHDIIRLSKACEDHKMVILRDYRSASGQRDRTIEVYKVWKRRGIIFGYDVNARKARLYKVCRAQSVDVLDTVWNSPRCATDVDIDPFDMMLDKTNAFTVKLLLTDYARQLLLETVPTAQTEAVRDGGRFTWRYQTRVSIPDGIVRFCMGLPEHLKVVEGDAVKQRMYALAHQITDN